jgi:cell wall-associated NlpC family hydrolase
MPLSPSAPSRARKSLLARFSTVLAGSVVAVTAMTMVAPAADAGAVQTSTTQASSTQDSSTQQSQMTARQRFIYKADRVMHVTSNQKGDPYRYGAAGPGAFDCSGLVYYTFRKALGRTLPRIANDQKRASHRIWHRSNLRRGDLVFETNSNGYAYHVGIYAGNGYFWHAPHSGTVVKKQKMYHARWRYGRIIKS